MAPEMSSESLMLRYQQGDLNAYVQLVDRHKNEVYRFCLRFLTDSYSAEDITQDVFVTLYRSVANYRAEAPLRAYLYRIARNACLTYLGKAKRITPISAAPSRYDAATERPSDKPEDSAIRSETQKMIRAAMAGLTEKQRTALYLSHFNELTYSEIAYVLDCPIGTVRSRISSAHAALKRTLSGERDAYDTTREAVNPDD